MQQFNLTCGNTTNKLLFFKAMNYHQVTINPTKYLKETFLIKSWKFKKTVDFCKVGIR